MAISWPFLALRVLALRDLELFPSRVHAYGAS